MFMALIVVTVSQVYTYLQTHQVVYIKYSLFCVNHISAKWFFFLKASSHSISINAHNLVRSSLDRLQIKEMGLSHLSKVWDKQRTPDENKQRLSIQSLL